MCEQLQSKLVVITVCECVAQLEPVEREKEIERDELHYNSALAHQPDFSDHYIIIQDELGRQEAFAIHYPWPALSTSKSSSKMYLFVKVYTKY